MSDLIHISATLAAIEARLGNIEATQKDQAQSFKTLGEKLFVGNGTPAIVTRLDRIEQAQQRRSTQMILLWTTILGILATVIGEKVVNRLTPPKPPAAIQQDTE